MPKLYVKELKVEEGGCIECGAGGMTRGLDPACETCGTSDVNNLTHGDWTFDVFLTEGGGIGFTVYEKGETRDNEHARCTDIIVNESPDPVGGVKVNVG